MKNVLDVCCGSRMFWHDRQDSRAVFCDIREEEHVLCDGRKLSIKPDMIADFRDLPFENNRFDVVIFDPPHLVSLGDKSWMKAKYGRLNKQQWESDIERGFMETKRVLRPGGTLIFKWNETQIGVSKVLRLTNGWEPLVKQRVGKNDKTHWIVFYKDRDDEKGND